MDENKKTLVVCGDSFNYGIGCTDLYTKPYGVLTAKHFDWNLIRLARGSSSNYVTFLQGSYAAKMTPKPHLVILGLTSYDRVEWLATGKKLDREPELTDVNYHLYPPHHEAQPLHDGPMDYHLRLHGEGKYSPKILSEQVVAFSDYMKHAKQGNMMGYYRRLHSESMDKLKQIEDYYMDIVDPYMKRDLDTGSIMLAYRRIKKAGINCIIVAADCRFSEFVDEERDYFNQDWGRCTKLWPDTVNSMHTGDGGHEDTANRLIKHIEEKGFM